MQAVNKRKPYKAYVKRLQNGFGIKTVDTETNAESIIMITTDKSEESQDVGKQQISQPVVNTEAEGEVFEQNVKHMET